MIGKISFAALLFVNEQPRYLERQRIAVGTADQFQHEVERWERTTGGDTFGVDNEPLADHGDLRIGAGEIVEILPMAGSRETIKQTGFGEDESAALYAGDQCPVAGGSRKEKFQFAGCRAFPVVTGQNKKRIGFAAGAECA